MRIAVVTTAAWGPPWSEGVRNIARCLVEFLASKGAAVSVITPPRGSRIPVVRSVAFGLGAARRARHAQAEIVVLIASVSPILGLRAWLLRRWTGKPVVIYVTGRRPFTLGYRAFLRPDAVLVNAPVLRAFFADAPVVPPMTDPRRWTPRSRTAAPKPPVILFLGAFERCRGVEDLIRAMDHVPETVGATLRLAWNGVGRERLPGILKLIRAGRAADRIQLTGTEDDVAHLYAEAAVVAIPRIAPERMAFPVRIVEAASMGVPLIVTRVNGMDELVDGCGLAVPPRDPPALGAAITRLLTDHALYARMALGCRERARAWDPTRSLETFYRYLTQAGRNGGG